MLLKYFNSNKAGLQIFILAIAIILWLHSWFEPAVAVSFNPALSGPIGRLLVNRVSAKPGLSAFLAMMVIVLYGYLLIQLNAKYLFLKTRSQLPQLFYIIVAGGLVYLHILSPAMLATLFVILLIFRLFKSFKKDRLVFNFLDAGILLAVAVLIYIPAVVLLPLLFITLILFRNMVWQEWIYPWIGFFIPFLFWGSYLFITDQSITIIMEEFRRAFSSAGVTHNHSIIALAFYGYLALLVIIGSFHMIRTIGIRKIQSRVFFIFFLWLFLLSVIAILVIPSASYEIIYTGGIPLAFLLSNYFATCNNTRMNNLLLVLLAAGFLLVVANDWFSFIPGHYSF
jgi:hypothetical protein